MICLAIEEAFMELAYHTDHALRVRILFETYRSDREYDTDGKCPTFEPYDSAVSSERLAKDGNISTICWWAVFSNAWMPVCGA